MRLSSLCVAAVLLLSVATFAQHSSGGGGGGSSSSGSSAGSGGGGGGTHGGGGGSSSSGGSAGGHSSVGSNSSSSAHSSGGSSSHASSGHSSSGHGSTPTSPSTHSSVNNSHSNHERSVREPNPGARVRTEMPEKRGFFGFLRHPFRKPEPKPTTVADLRRPVPCLKGPCAVCPPGQAHGGGCGGTFYLRHEHRHCTSGEIWSGGSCLLQTQFLDSCNSLRMTMQRQEQRMRAAESQRQSACAAVSSQACMDSASAAQSEAALYRTLQEQYQRCMQRSLSSQSSAGFGLRGYSAGRLFEPFDLRFSNP